MPLDPNRSGGFFAFVTYGAGTWSKKLGRPRLGLPFKRPESHRAESRRQRPHSIHRSDSSTAVAGWATPPQSEHHRVTVPSGWNVRVTASF
jgi:hypothetical protein